jgi:uncharacterized caspase-like protein
VIARIGPFLTPFALVIAVLVALVPVAAFAADKQRVALVIGNADYPDLNAPLDVALINARAVAEQLQNAGFEVDAIENTTKDSLRGSLQGFYQKIEYGAIVVFFY